MIVYLYDMKNVMPNNHYLKVFGIKLKWNCCCVYTEAQWHMLDDGGIQIRFKSWYGKEDWDERARCFSNTALFVVMYSRIMQLGTGMMRIDCWDQKNNKIELNLHLSGNQRSAIM